MQLWYFIIFLADGAIAAQLIHAAIDREISAWSAGVMMFLLLALNGVMLTHANDPIGPILALIIIAFALTHRLLRTLVDQRALAAIQMQDMREYQKMIEEDPSLPYPYQAIGDFFFERQMWEEAIAYYKKFLTIQDDPEVKWKLEHAQDELRRQVKGLRLCPHCLSEIPADAVECPVCGHYLGTKFLQLFLSALGKAETVLIVAILAAIILFVVVRSLRLNPALLLALVPLLILVAVYGGIVFVGRFSPRR